VLVHSSDLHLTHELYVDQSHVDQLSNLRRVLTAAETCAADVVLLAGDVFDHNRQPAGFLDQVADALSITQTRVVFLPGNHDPLTPDSVYLRGGFVRLPNVAVLGVSVGDAVHLPELGLEIWGRPHTDYDDMSPLRDPLPRSTRWQVAVAHGHFAPDPIEPGRFYGSWLIREADLAATGADYVALGHWNRPARVGNGRVPAYYSGSPDFARCVNVIRLRADGQVEVAAQPLPDEGEWLPTEE
jgi:DNA repair exonuclease SbcCD nuclease subunit